MNISMCHFFNSSNIVYKAEVTWQIHRSIVAGWWFALNFYMLICRPLSKPNSEPLVKGYVVCLHWRSLPDVSVLTRSYGNVAKSLMFVIWGDSIETERERVVLMWPLPNCSSQNQGHRHYDQSTVGRFLTAHVDGGANGHPNQSSICNEFVGIDKD